MLILFHTAIVILCTLHILLRRHRAPESRLAWLVMVFALPYVGALAYLLPGNTNIGNKRALRLTHAFAALAHPKDAPGWDAPEHAPHLPDEAAPLFRVGQSISGYPAVGGNSARLMADSDATIAQMVADIDEATATVHLMFYIWLTDHNGTRMAEALMRAAKRGIACPAAVDDLGSHDLIKSQLWRDMGAAGLRLARALQIGMPLIRVFTGRIDLRNHRKILVVDNRITFCGSQNCADPAFLPKARFAPWVDAVMRFEGPVVRENQHLFATDWMEITGEDLSPLLREPMPPASPGFTAQVVGTGPTMRASAMPELFVSLIHSARRDLFVTTPYYVPDAALQSALTAAAWRGVDVTIIFPARNDDFAVGAASRSYYGDLLAAGVKIHEFQPGLLHAKSLTLDGNITLIGSAIMDRRSFDLNYENNILLYDEATTAALRARQIQYLAQSRPVTRDEVDGWPMHRRLWNNALTIVGPVL